MEVDGAGGCADEAARLTDRDQVESDDYLSFGGYDLRIEPGERRELIIAVTSLGILGVKQYFEWVGTTRGIAAGRHIMFLRDTRHSWYNAEEGWRDLIDRIRAHCFTHRIERIFVFGVSMGAFGAGLLAAQLPVTAALLLAPQASIDLKDAAFDDRFLEVWQALPGRPRPDLRWAATGGTRFLCCFSVDDAYDISHVALLRAALPGCTFLPIRGEHNVAQELRIRGHHVALLRHMLGDGEMPDILQHPLPMADLIDMAGLVLRDDVAEMKAWTDRLLADGRPDLVPGLLHPALRWSMRPPRGTPAALAHKLLGRRIFPAHRGMSFRGNAILPYLQQGWGDLDQEGFPAQSPRPTMRALMTDRELNRDVSILLSGWLSFGEGAQRQVRAWQGRHLLLDETLEGHGLAHVSVTIPARGPRIDLRLDLECPHDADPGFTLTLLRFLEE